MKNQRWEIFFVFLIPLLAIAIGLTLPLIKAFFGWNEITLAHVPPIMVI